MQADDGGVPEDLLRPGGDPGHVAHPRLVRDVREEEPPVAEDPPHIAQPLDGRQPGRDPAADEGVEDDGVRAPVGQRRHAVLPGHRADPDAVAARQRQLAADGLGEVGRGLEDDLRGPRAGVLDLARQGEPATADVGGPQGAGRGQSVEDQGEVLDVLEGEQRGVLEVDGRLRQVVEDDRDEAALAVESGVAHDVEGTALAGSVGSMPPRRRTDPALGLAALRAWHADPDGVDRSTRATAVRHTLEELAARAPGNSVEVRVPPFGVVQCVEGPRHTRGTPPNVVETDAETWLHLATGSLAWAEALADGVCGSAGHGPTCRSLLPLGDGRGTGPAMRHGIVLLTDEPGARRRPDGGRWRSWVRPRVDLRPPRVGRAARQRVASAVPTLAAAAGVTERVGLGTFVSSPNQHHPYTYARDVITLDDLSGGRFLCGVGTGGDLDARLLGADLALRQRVERFHEFVPLLDRLLREDHVDHDGDWYTTRDARTLPGPVRHRVPLLVAANGPRSIRLAAEHGDGWVTYGGRGETLEEWFAHLAEIVDRFGRALADAGRERRRPLPVTRLLPALLAGVRRAVRRAGRQSRRAGLHRRRQPLAARGGPVRRRPRRPRGGGGVARRPVTGLRRPP